MRSEEGRGRRGDIGDVRIARVDSDANICLDVDRKNVDVLPDGGGMGGFAKIRTVTGGT